MRTRATAAACLALCCGVLHGCIVLPVPVLRSSGPTASSRAGISKTLPEQIKAGQSTRNDVLLLLGEPDGRGEQDRRFIYTSRVGRGGVGWELFWAVGAGYGGGTSGTVKLGGDSETVRRATILFDELGVVSQVIFAEYHCAQGKGCTEIRGSDISAREKGRGFGSARYLNKGARSFTTPALASQPADSLYLRRSPL